MSRSPKTGEPKPWNRSHLKAVGVKFRRNHHSEDEATGDEATKVEEADTAEVEGSTATNDDNNSHNNNSHECERDLKAHKMSQTSHHIYIFKAFYFTG